MRARTNDDVALGKRLGLKDTPGDVFATWRRRNGIPEPQMVKLRAIAVELAGDDERDWREALQALTRLVGPSGGGQKQTRRISGGSDPPEPVAAPSRR